ncbi:MULTISPECIES: DUF3515 family protein [Brachybacterium]|uniref:DUF3515 domain-containing protein n=1 Tax=Brachybacterium kimchii TaxID=2942909 RepID=A0ABY4N6X3_9MICO|nr:DUF3515 family protein [Brachybacterium kimchii]UQN30303.1 DUF3515 domain-containing protein [Brachybacterium kimchii]
MRRALPRLPALPALLAGALVLGCSACATVRVPAGEDAADPACAQIVQDAPEQLEGQSRHATSSQGTLAWGSGDEAIVLRCGVAPPGPTTQMCTTLTDADGTGVDWIIDEDGSSDGIVRFTTYGRTPAIDLTVPREVVGDQASAAALDLTDLVTSIPAERHCLGADDVQ